MKIILTGIAAAALMATGVAAQTTSSGTMTPTTPSNTSEPAMTPPAGDTGMAASASGAEAAMLTERNGKWYNGDREATSTEIAAYKKMKKAGRPS